MADHIQFQVSITPIEELTTENSGTEKIVASEVGKSLSGSGDSVDLANYGQTASNQGYLNATVNYADAKHTARGEFLPFAATDFYFIKNTGFKFSSVTALGTSTTDCVMVVLKENPFANGSTAGFTEVGGTARIHFYEIAWLKPGQAIILPTGASNLSITQFGDNATDLSRLSENVSATGLSLLAVRTYQSDGSAATDGNAVEYLAVT